MDVKTGQLRIFPRSGYSVWTQPSRYFSLAGERRFSMIFASICRMRSRVRLNRLLISTSGRHGYPKSPKRRMMICWSRSGKVRSISYSFS